MIVSGVEHSLNLHAHEIRELRQRLRTAEVTLAVVLAYLVLDLLLGVIV